MVGATSQVYDSNDFRSNIYPNFEAKQTNDQPNFSGFGQKSKGDIREGFTIIPNILLVNDVLDSNEKLVISALRCFCWNDKKVCWPSRSTLSQMTGISERVLVDVFASLSGKRIISYQRTGYAGHNEYIFLDESIEAMIQRLESRSAQTNRSVESFEQASSTLNTRSTTPDQRSTTQISKEIMINYDYPVVAQKPVSPMVAICAEIALMVSELGYYLGKTDQIPVSHLDSISAKSASESYEFKNTNQEACMAGVQACPSANLIDSGKNRETRSVQTSNHSTNIPKSVYSLELCQEFTNQYAKSKLNTPDEIQDLARFALYCYRTGEKDLWLGAFVANGHQLAPYNPLAEANLRNKSESKPVSQVIEQASNDPQPLQSKQVQAIKAEAETNEHTQATSLPLEPKGRFSAQTYQDYVERVEVPRATKMGRTIHSTASLAKYLQNTGGDDAKVTQFVERMKTLTLGGRGEIDSLQSSTSVTRSVIDQVTNTVTKEATERVAQQIQESQGFSAIGQSMLREIEAIQQREAAQELTFSQLSEAEQAQLIAAKYEVLMTSEHRKTYKRMSEQALQAQIIQLVKKDLVSNC